MFERTRYRIGLAATAFSYGRKEDNVQVFTKAVSHSKKALVIVPSSDVNQLDMQDFLRQFLSKFRLRSLVILAPMNSISKIHFGSATFITYNEREINRFFLPVRMLRRKIKLTQYDICIDLNSTLDLPSAVLCRESRAPIRISFSKPHGERFYNFLFNAGGELGGGKLYDRLLKCMEMF